ncbi:uncharacterized protein [Ptychodera flava]|uniref:uncharacterized protein n=1 Tax=Ptychodera flava TaxID=63121 RepID=UPI00396A379A
MASGVGVDEGVVPIFDDIKLKNKYSYIIFHIEDHKKIKVLKAEEDLTKTYKDFCAELPKNECRYGVYDFRYTLDDGGIRNKLVFYHWVPDTAKVKDKMVYASSKDALRKKLVGIRDEQQATDDSELNYDEIKEKISKGGTS